jgi:glycosyltransferase involved in cell wall biosynthesis
MYLLDLKTMAKKIIDTFTSSLVSIIVPVHNGEKFLSEALDSLLRQDYDEYEIIVVDDGSTDSTSAIARSYGSTIRFFQLPESKGPGYARNYAIRESKGAFLGFIDSDDMWTHNKLTAQLNYLKLNPWADFVISRMTPQLEGNQEWPFSLNSDHYLNDNVALLLSATLIKKQSFLKVGWFDSQLATAEDVDWFTRASDIKLRRGVVDEVLLIKRIHSANVSLYSGNTNRDLFKALRRSVSRKKVFLK